MCNFDCYIVHTLLMAKDALRAIFFRKSSWFYFYGWRVDVSPWIDIWRFSVSCIIGHLHFVIPSGEIFACFTNFCANFLCEEDTVVSTHLNFPLKFSIRNFQLLWNLLAQKIFLMSFLAWKFTWDNFWVIFKQRRIINQLLFIARESFFFFCGEGEGVATVGNWFSRWLSFNCDYFLITT